MLFKIEDLIKNLQDKTNNWPLDRFLLADN